MYLVDELAAEQSRSTMQRVEQMRPVRRQLALRRAQRMERKAERRLIQAWRRAAEVRGTLESLDY
jgi:hypothetical protein